MLNSVKCSWISCPVEIVQEDERKLPYRPRPSERVPCRVVYTAPELAHVTHSNVGVLVGVGVVGGLVSPTFVGAGVGFCVGPVGAGTLTQEPRVDTCCLIARGTR